MRLLKAERELASSLEKAGSKSREIKCEKGMLAHSTTTDGVFRGVRRFIYV